MTTVESVTEAQRFHTILTEHDLDPICRSLVAKNGWDEDTARDVADEYRKFMAIKAAYPGVRQAPSEVVDEFWHKHLLFLRDYEQMCLKVNDGLLYHFQCADRDFTVSVYTGNTLPALRREFGELNSEYWPWDEVAMCHCAGCD